MGHREQLDGVVPPEHRPVPAEFSNYDFEPSERQRYQELATKVWDLARRRYEQDLKLRPEVGKRRDPSLRCADLTWLNDTDSSIMIYRHRKHRRDRQINVMISYSDERAVTDQPGVLVCEEIFTMQRDRRGQIAASRYTEYSADPTRLPDFAAYCHRVGRPTEPKHWEETLDGLPEAALDELYDALRIALTRSRRGT